MEIDATEYIKRAKIGPANNSSNAVFNTILSLLARLLIVTFGFYTNIVFYYHQVLYFIQREFLYANRTPQLVRQDVANLSKVPRHIAFVLEISPATGLEGLMNQVLESTSWCLGVGSPSVTLYERTGALKAISLQSVAEAVATGLARYFRTAEDVPSICIRSGKQVVTKAGSGLTSAAAGNSNLSGPHMEPTLTVTLASEQDGRPMLVSLAQEYAVSIGDGKLQKSDITVNKIHKELQERVGDEPDLLVTFGSHLDFAGFSPWLLRVTELFCLQDNNGVFHYLVFFRALQKFANVKVNLGA